MLGMWITPGGWFDVEPSDDSKWESGGTKTPMDTPEGKWGPDIQDVLPDEGWTAAMSCGRVPRDSGNKDCANIY